MTQPVDMSLGRNRMTRAERHEQLLDVSRELFASKGYDATSIEEIAARAGVSKPIVYGHFVTKEALCEAVVDREMATLLQRITGSLTGGTPRQLLTNAVDEFLRYVEDNAAGFRVLTRESPTPAGDRRFGSVLAQIAALVEDGFARAFAEHGEDARMGAASAQMLVGMVAFAGHWWQDAGLTDRDQLAEHIVRLAWHGLSDMVYDQLPS